VDEWWDAEDFDARGANQIILNAGCHRRTKRIWLMGHHARLEAALMLRIEKVSLDEEVFQGSRRGRGELASAADFDFALYTAFNSVGVVTQVVRLNLDAHVGMEVRQSKPSTSDLDGDAIRGLEAEEPNPRLSSTPMDVGSHVGLVKGGQPGKRGQGDGSNPGHREGDEANVGLAIVGVNLELGRNEALEKIGRDGPMQERQVRPALVHDGAAIWSHG